MSYGLWWLDVLIWENASSTIKIYYKNVQTHMVADVDSATSAW